MEKVFNEIARKLGDIRSSLCKLFNIDLGITNIDTNIDEITSKIPTNSVTRTKVLTGSLSALTSETCILVEIYNSDTTAITLQANGGVSHLLPESSITPIYTTNANTILVRGTGTLEYKVVK